MGQKPVKRGWGGVPPQATSLRKNICYSLTLMGPVAGKPRETHVIFTIAATHVAKGIMQSWSAHSGVPKYQRKTNMNLAGPTEGEVTLRRVMRF